MSLYLFEDSRCEVVLLKIKIVNGVQGSSGCVPNIESVNGPFPKVVSDAIQI